jgi:flagellar basal-body rod modification protein FlgD
MSTINAVSPGITTKSTKSDSGSNNTMTGASAQEIEDRFLTLLVSQIKNQDPLNPLDNAQLTTQLAQISTVGGIDRMNTTLSAIQALLAAQKTETGSGTSGGTGGTSGSGSTATTGTKAS